MHRRRKLKSSQHFFELFCMKSMLAGDIPSLSCFENAFIATQPSEFVKGRQMMKNRIYDVDASFWRGRRLMFCAVCRLMKILWQLYQLTWFCCTRAPPLSPGPVCCTSFPRTRELSDRCAAWPLTDGRVSATGRKAICSVSDNGSMALAWYHVG